MSGPDSGRAYVRPCTSCRCIPYRGHQAPGQDPPSSWSWLTGAVQNPTPQPGRRFCFLPLRLPAPSSVQLVSLPAHAQSRAGGQPHAGAHSIESGARTWFGDPSLLFTCNVALGRANPLWLSYLICGLGIMGP